MERSGTRKQKGSASCILGEATRSRCSSDASPLDPPSTDVRTCEYVCVCVCVCVCVYYIYYIQRSKSINIGVSI